jgi:gliding motility-associated-like protein
MIRALLVAGFLFVFSFTYAQTCPSNVDFELGNFTNWHLFRGTCCPINTPTSGTSSGRHTITSGTATDPYGGFPIVAPGGGSYSLKLGNSNTGAQAERARYFIRIPSGINNYSLIFRYAVVFEDPGHVAADQPRFEVKAYDSITNAIINCSQFNYIATSSLPGFTVSSINNGALYKSWSTASINLSGYAGRTVAVDFASGDCAQGAHFGYGYVDLNCGLFQISYNACDTSSTVSLSAPPGFNSYVWRDSSTWSTVGTGQSVTIARPTTTKTYAVILTPYTGFGCPDTLYTKVTINNLTVNATRDTTICRGSSIQLNANATASATPITYNWTPTTALSCSTCANPLATPLTTTTYYVTATDANGCTKNDTVVLTVSNPQVAVARQHVSCFGGANGTLTATPSGGFTPYTYSWNTSPVRTTAAINGLSAGTYILTMTDNAGCVVRDTSVITQPTLLNASIASRVNVSCYNGTNGSATVSVSGGTAPYTYSWNTTPVKTTATATGLGAGSYIVTVTDSKGCIDTANVTITQPTVLNASLASKTNVSCFGGNNGNATVSVSGGTSPYTYSWNSSTVQTTATATSLPAGTYIVTVTDTLGCFDTALAVITQPSQLNASITAITNVSCFGAATGSTTVTATGGTSPYTYSWNTSPAQTTATASGLNAGSYIVTVTDTLGCTDTALAVITQPTVLNSSIAASANVNCFGGNNGTASLNVTGGTTPYTYSWNTSPAQTTAAASNLAAGTYIASVTDAKGCTDTAVVVITQPAVLNASISSSNNVRCFGEQSGNATVSVTGGTSPYTYSWNTTPVKTTATVAMGAGTYIATVTDSKGCTDTALVVITQPAVLNASIGSSTNVSCFGGSNGTATTTVSGGTSPYTYSWTTSPVQTTATATTLSAGSYIVTVTDTVGCIDTALVTITQPNVLSAAIPSHTNVSCFGGNNGTATASVSGGTAPYTYSWNTSPAQTGTTATALAAGAYTVTVTDAKGCMAIATITISQPAKVSLVLSSKTDATCNGINNGAATVAATGGTSPYTYWWNTTPAQTSASATALAAGNYIAVATDSAGCKDTLAVVITQPYALNAGIGSKTNTRCFGEANGSATVSVSGGTSPYTYSWNTAPVQTTATASGLAAGTYIATVTDAGGCNDTALVVIAQPAVLNANISAATNISCFGGSNGTATVSATGGTLPYTYSWNTSPVQTSAIATALPVGSFVATVTDALGCTDTANITITQPPVLNAAVTAHTNVSCFGGNNGTATVSATGGTAPYTYVWNTSPAQTTATAIGLSAGTYTVVVTDAKGCTSTTSVAITQPTQLNLSLVSKTNASCNGINNGTATIAATGGTSPYTYWWNTTPAQTSTTATSLASGGYMAVVTDSAGCTDTLAVVISQPGALNANIGSVTNVSCNGGANGAASVVITGGTTPYTYIWNTNPVQTGATATSLAAGTYTATVTDAMGCSDTAVAVIQQPAVLTASISAYANATCFGGNNGSAAVNATGGNLPYTYSWNTSPVKTTQSVTGLSAGTYQVTVTDAKGCSAIATVNISHPAQLNASISSKINVSCNGLSNGAATVATIGGTTPYTYTWNTTPAQVAATATALPAGIYIATVTDANGCSDTAVVSISQPALLNAGITQKQDVSCNGYTNGSATVAAIGGTLPYAYSWNTSPVQSNAVAISLPAGAYIATVTDANGCTDTAMVNLNQPTALNATITNKTDVACFNGNNGQATATATGGTSPYTYSWNTSPIQSSATANTLRAGAYVVTVTDNKGCTDTAQLTISQPAQLIASITGKTDALCNGSNDGTAMGSATGGTSPYAYSWNTSPVQTTPTATAIAAGFYTLTIRDQNGCTATDTVSIAEPIKIKVTVEPLDKTCIGASSGSAVIKATSGGIAPYTYMWNTTPAFTTTLATGLAGGTYSVRVTDATGCSVIENVTVLNFPQLQLGTLPDTEVCPGSKVQLIATGAKTYNWFAEPTLSCLNCADPVASPVVNTRYYVVGIDTNNCRDTAGTMVSIIPKRKMDVGVDLEICEGDQAQLHAEGGKEYTWFPVQSLNDNKSSAPVAIPTQTTRYMAVIKQNECYTDTLYQNVTVRAKPFVDLGPDLDGVVGASFKLNAKTSNVNKIEWLPPTGLSCVDCYNPVAIVDKSIVYKVIVYNGEQCKATDDIAINVKCDESIISLPNTFTPNGDGANDMFWPISKGGIIVDKMLVFNRWGERVFEAYNIPVNDPSKGWDGTFKGKALTPDVFVYIIETKCITGERIVIKGDISLIR